MPPCNRDLKGLFLDGIEAPCGVVDCSLIVRVENNQKWFAMEFFRLQWAAGFKCCGALLLFDALWVKRLHKQLSPSR